MKIFNFHRVVKYVVCRSIAQFCIFLWSRSLCSLQCSENESVFVFFANLLLPSSASSMVRIRLVQLLKSIPFAPFLTLLCFLMISYKIPQSIFLGVDANRANDFMFDVLELVETYLFVNSFVSLVELFEELPGQVELLLNIVF